ncbi:phage tail tape measure protein [Nonomuraea sp. NPDC050404]|uniref:phage tail tape measure protein n=1 Tax=Nonomuraea sp. NPDC050404 TaxID=3155783 RepID=UPI0033ED4C7A
MAGLTVGELVGFIDLQDEGFASELNKAGTALDKLQSTTSSKTAAMESTVSRSMADIERALSDGLDPTEAIADLDKLEAELDAAFAAIVEDADKFAAELEAEVDAAFASMDDDARESGRRAGRELVDGLEAGLEGAERTAHDAGRDAGRRFSDGVEDGTGGGGGGGGGGMAGVGAGLIGGLKAGAIGVAAAAGAAIGGAIVDGIKTSLERENLFAELAVKVGAFGAESERLGKIAGDLYADAYGESLGEVTAALARVIQDIDGAGKLGDDALKDMTAQAMTVGRTMDEDVGAVTRAVSQIMRNDLAPSAEDAFDVLVRGQQEGVNKSGDLLDTFNEYSTIFRDLGLNAEDALGLMAQGLKAGARDSDTVADGLKELDIRVKDLSAKGALKSLGLDAQQMADAFAKGGPKAREALGQILERLSAVKDPAERSRLAVELFGTKAEDMAGALNALNLDSAKTAVGGFENAVATAGKTLGDTAKADADRWGRSWEDMWAGLGEHAMFVIQDMFPSPAELEAGWNELSTWFSTTVGPTFSEGWTAVKDKTVEIWNGIGEWLSTKTTEIADWIGQTPAKVGEFFSTGWESVKTLTSEKWEGIKSAATDKANAAVEWLQGVPGTVAGFFSSGWENLKSDTSSKWEGIKSAATDKATELITWLKGVPGKIKAEFSAAGTWLLQAGKDVIDGLINGVKSKVSDAVSAVKGVGQSVINAAQSVFDTHSPSEIFDGIGQMVTTGLANGIAAVKGAATAAVSTVASQVIGTAKTATGTGTGAGPGGQPSTVMHEIGKLTVQGLIKGLTAEGGRATETVKTLVSQIKSAFKSQPDVADGLLEFVKGGNASLEVLAAEREALVSQLGAAKEAAKTIAGDAKEWASIMGLNLQEGAGVDDVINGLKNRVQALKDFAANVTALAKSGLNKETLRQIIQAGPEAGASMAEMLVGADGSEIKAINKAQTQINKVATQVGKAGADAMYDTGKKAGDGYLKGLEESLKKTDALMTKIVKALVTAVKRELKIKSPSVVMAEIGQYTMQGLSQGMQSMLSSVVATAQGIISKAVAAARKAAGSAAASAGGGGSTGGSGSMIAGDYGSGGYVTVAPMYGVDAPSSSSSGVTVNIAEATVREEADFAKLGAQFGFEYTAHA